MFPFVEGFGLTKSQATPIVNGDRRPSEKNGLTFNPKKRRSEGWAKEVWCPWVNHCSRVCIYRCIHTGPWISHCNHASPIVTGLTTPQLGFRMVTTNGVKGQLSQPPTMMGPKGSTIRADWKFIAMKEVCGTEVVGVHDWRRLRVFDHDSVRTEVGMMTSYRPNWQAKSSGLWTKSVNGGIYR